MLCPSLHLFAAVGDDLACGGFEWSNLDGARAKGFLHALIHGADVATVRGDLDAVTQVEPVVICTLASNPLDVVASSSVGSQCFLGGLFLVLEECSALGSDGGLHLLDPRLEPVFTFSFPHSEGV